MIAHTACSRLEPVPKLGPPMRMLAPAKRSSLSTKLRSSRHDEKRPLPKPVRSTRLSHSAGMIWSVSTSERSSGTAVPWTIWTACMRAPSRVREGEVAGDGGGGGDGGGDEVGAPAPALAALEVAVAGGRRALAGGELVRVHGQAHRAARLPPVEAGGGEHLVEPLGLGLVLHGEAAGHDERADARPSPAGPRPPWRRPAGPRCASWCSCR